MSPIQDRGGAVALRRHSGGHPDNSHDAADHVLCVMSDDFLKAPYSTLERNAALWQAASKRPGFVLFVAVKPCRLPTLSDHMRRCVLFGIPPDAARLASTSGLKASVSDPGRVLGWSISSASCQ